MMMIILMMISLKKRSLPASQKPMFPFPIHQANYVPITSTAKECVGASFTNMIQITASFTNMMQITTSELLEIIHKGVN